MGFFLVFLNIVLIILLDYLLQGPSRSFSLGTIIRGLVIFGGDMSWIFMLFLFLC